jgi:hypothetical protein
VLYFADYFGNTKDFCDLFRDYDKCRSLFSQIQPFFTVFKAQMFLADVTHALHIVEAIF